ncbi:MAG: U32 family peptidase [Defluviitaleaceae bacterium]|nr:U32 family peptidase [Defluviitaleaceae bacterium]
MSFTSPELLVPAGDMESAKAAITAGADAIYLGGKNFSARSFATNFEDDEIEHLINYAALRGVKIYIAVNTLYSNDEIPKVLDFTCDMHKRGAAAFILQDMGLAHVLKNQLPEIELHASTQMTVHSVNGAQFMKKAGFSRVILSRELSIAEITHINKEANIKTEVFAHGALCLSYSGQCLLSSMVGARSGNRGKCAQPCRLTYDLLKNGKSIKSGHLLSPKDMMTLEILEEVISTGITALKIEGRMKSPEYVYTVTKAYRQQLDERKARIDKGTLNDVTQIFNRGGSFSTGYYKDYASIDMMSIETPKSTGVFCGTVTKYVNGKCTIRFVQDMIPGDGIEIWTSKGAHVGMGINREIKKNDTATLIIDGNISIGNDVFKSFDKRLTDEAKRGKTSDTKKLEIIGEVEAKIGQPVCLVLYSGQISAKSISGTVVEKGQKAPMGKDDVLAQLSKTGNAPFSIRFTRVDIDDGIFISKAVLNEVRRMAIEALEHEIITSIKRPMPSPINYFDSIQNAPVPTQKLTVQIKDIDKLNLVLAHEISRVYIDWSENNLEKFINLQRPSHAAEIFLALPPISRNDLEDSIKSWAEKLEAIDFDGYLVATYGQLNILQSLPTKKKIILDHNIHIFNNYSKQAFANVDVVTLSQELNTNQLRHMNAHNSEIIVHGKQVLMATPNCPIGLYAAEKNGKYCSEKLSSNRYVILDRMSVQFPIMTDCENCIAYILNSKTLDTAHRFPEVKNTGIGYLRLIFRFENDETISNTIQSYTLLMAGEETLRKATESTYGHFFRGVD